MTHSVPTAVRSR